ncbi:hypothetical protein M0R45_034478 [Rubus argutus]|uniref:Tetrahydrofolate dehydrogenase/cyclohydrolase catalytic domain-containing protein n=1 Tax=Rubus argutus TaxID=59490 RepID=A0AAW1VS17_RUBAR
MGVQEILVVILVTGFCFQAQVLSFQNLTYNPTDFQVLQNFVKGLDTVIDGWGNGFSSDCCKWPVRLIPIKIRALSYKNQSFEVVWINSFELHLPEDATEQEVLNSVSGFNDDPPVHGILVQLPLPSHMDEQNILNAVSIEKDVDGFHLLNIGCLAMRGREPCLFPVLQKAA